MPDYSTTGTGGKRKYGTEVSLMVVVRRGITVPTLAATSMALSSELTSRVFAWKSNMTVHLRTHDVNRRREYVCTFPNCNKVCTQDITRATRPSMITSIWSSTSGFTHVIQKYHFSSASESLGIQLSSARLQQEVRHSWWPTIACESSSQGIILPSIFNLVAWEEVQVWYWWLRSCLCSSNRSQGIELNEFLDSSRFISCEFTLIASLILVLIPIVAKYIVEGVHPCVVLRDTGRVEASLYYP